MLLEGKVKKLRINGLVSKSFPGKRHVRIQRGVGGGEVVQTPPPEKSQKYRVSKHKWSGSPKKAQGYQASIKCWATSGTQRNAI